MPPKIDLGTQSSHQDLYLDVARIAIRDGFDGTAEVTGRVVHARFVADATHAALQPLHVRLAWARQPRGDSTTSDLRLQALFLGPGSPGDDMLRLKFRSNVPGDHEAEIEADVVWSDGARTPLHTRVAVNVVHAATATRTPVPEVQPRPGREKTHQGSEVAAPTHRAEPLNRFEPLPPPKDEAARKQVPNPTAQWTVDVARGAHGGGKARPMTQNKGEAIKVTCFAGDTVNVRAAFTDLAETAVSVVKFESDVAGSMTGPAEGATTGRAAMGVARWARNVATIPFTATSAGKCTLYVWPRLPDVEPGTGQAALKVELSIVHDPRGFKDRCTSATALLQEKYAKGRKFFLEASQHYLAAYERHKAVLDERGRRERLTRDIMIAVLFGTLGGAAGGAIGGALKGWSDKFAKTASNMAAGMVTDAAKDLTKAVVRLMPTALGSKGGVPGASGATVAAGAGKATGQAGAVGGDMLAPAAVDPFAWFLAVEAALEHEKGIAAEMLAKMHVHVDAILSTGTDHAFDYDPLVALEEHCTIDGLPLDKLGEPPAEKEYEKAFWAAWLSQYAWVVGTRRFKGDTSSYARDNVDGIVRAGISEAAGRHGEKADAWIDQYGGDAKQRANREATRQNVGGGLIP